MPQNNFQRFIFALITVFITVHCFVFYNVALSNGGASIQMLAHARIALFVLIEFCCALTLELLVGSPYSIKLALKMADQQKIPPFIFETIIICCTVLLMCPMMSFLAVIIYDGFFPFIDGTFSASNFFVNFIPYWFQKIVFNFPFALLIQLFFIQPLVRKIFGSIFCSKKEQNTNVQPTAEAATVDCTAEE